MSTDPELIDVSEVTTAVVAGEVEMAQLRDFFDRSFSSLPATVASQGVAITGPAFARYHGPPGQRVDLEVGFPTDRAVESEGDVQPGVLPAGRVARLVHRGSYDELGPAWGRLRSWIEQSGLTAGHALWEVYVTEPSPEMDPADLRTDLHWTVSEQ